jgi:hypothetical protein
MSKSPRSWAEPQFTALSHGVSITSRITWRPRDDQEIDTEGGRQCRTDGEPDHADIEDLIEGAPRTHADTADPPFAMPETTPPAPIA